MDINKEQWIVQCKDGMHIVNLCYIDDTYANLCVDDNVIDKIKIKHFLNYEYKFNIQEKKCSFVKLVTDKSFGFVVDGEYQNMDRKYAPITKTPILTWIALAIDLMVLIAFAIYTFNVNLSIYNKMFFIMMFATFALVLTYFIRIVCNSPCVIKNPTHNLMLRCLLIVIVETIYALMTIGLFDLINIFK